ncbi:hypothetical protein FE633_11495 [Streptomyces montanus]|uniref:Uncharacterized protein n=1 Tax=Streptomyces montanus TaxID=2580423 RepID=A0A5R9FQG5_9ACTN|nr:hypothetical protein [Streptomyces montanus]TLS46152.1 hypothetical protein FE633_11495 [Streptomyces montanus]
MRAPWPCGSHDRATLLKSVEFGRPGCITCLSRGPGRLHAGIFEEEFAVNEKDIPIWEDEGPEGW